MGIQTVVQEGVKIMDMFADTESEQYQAFKSMLTLWNPESSKWAVQASKGYKKALNLRASRYVISYTYSNISSVVEFQRWWVLKSKLFGQELTYTEQF